MSTKKSISHVYTILFVLVFMLALAFSALDVTPAYAAGVRYAKPAASGTGDCSSWANACTLQTALTGAISGDEIWAAAGTYKPTTGADRNATFQLKSGVTLYGGFAGTETMLSERDPAVNVTTLSGDLNSDDGGFINNSENVYHVVTGANNATLDGFTITAGNADDASASGGGMFNVSSSPTLTNVTLSGNSTTMFGGGMYNSSSNPTLTNVTFSDNQSSGDGGGMYNNYSSPALTNVTFLDNRTAFFGVFGGGMYNYESSPTLTNVTFSGNLATYGGGMSNRSYSNPTLINVTFFGNGGEINDVGGGMYNENSSNPMLTNVTFSDNYSNNGGGMTNLWGCSPSLTNVTFSDNVALNGGGMFNVDGSHPTLTNVAFYGNKADNDGGGMYNGASNPILTNVTFSGNLAATSGGGMFNNVGSIPVVQNSILWGNAPQDVFNDGGIPTIRYSLVEGCNPGGAWNSACGTNGGNNLPDADPLFVAPEPAGSAPTTTGDYRLQDTSPAINAGDNAADLDGAGSLTATIGSLTQDLDGNHRFVRVLVDLGAYENQTFPCPTGGVLYVDQDTVGQQTGASWSDALTTLQDALQVSEACEIWVAEGVYLPDEGGSQTDNDRTATFQLKDGVALYGGFAGTETARDQRDPAANLTTLSGDLNGDDVGVTNNSENVYHVVRGTTGATLDGFTITAGNAEDNTGGGMYNISSSPTLMNITFSGNSADEGGGMYNDSSSPTLANVTFNGNMAIYGGGLCNSYDSSPTLTNVTFSGNSANYGGGMRNSFGSSPTLTNITFNGNSANYGGGIGNWNSSSPAIRNTIFWDNTAVTAGAQIYNESSTPILSDNVVQGGCPAGSTCTHIITSDPLLGTLGNYGGLTQTIPLLAHSSAINTGKNATCAATDQCGIIRPQGARCDIGAFELVDNTPPNTSIDSQNPPTTPTNSTSMTFTFSGTDTVSGVKSFECALDGGGFAACSSPKSYASLADGAHTFQVHAIDFVGNVDASPASRTWTVNTTAPTVNSFTVVTPSNNLNIPITAFSATDDLPVTGYLITTSSTPPAAAAAGWTGTAPVTYTVASDGSYNLYPWAKDAAGNVSTVFAAPPTVVVDSTAPETTIINKPANPDNDSTPTFTFSGDDGTGSGVASFMCRLDGGSYTSCTSPFTSPALASGSHTFYVYAIDMLGNADASPASYTWLKPFIIFLPLILH